MKKKHRITLVVGDWSTDGHEKTERFHFECSSTADAVESAYARGCEKLGFSPSDEMNTEYEDFSISADHYTKLKESGYKCAGYINENDLDHIYCDGPDEFVDIYLHVVKLGNSKIKFKKIVDDSVIDIGGYGLFN